MNNALKYVRILEETGITRVQAEAHVQLITEVMEDNLTTKQDLKNLETKLDTSLQRLDHKLETSIERLERKLDTSIERLEHKMLQIEYRMTIKLGTIVTIVVTAATAVIKLL